MARKFVGIALKSTRVEVVLISNGLSGAQPLAQVELDLDPVKPGQARDRRRRVATALGAAVGVLRERGWTDLPIGIALPPGECSYRALQFPFADPKRIADAIGFEIDGKFPDALEDLVFDHHSFAHEKAGQVLVAAARRDIVEDVSASVRSWGLELRAITTPAAATSLVVARPAKAGANEAGEGAASLIVDIGMTTSEVVAVGAKGLVAARSFRFGRNSLRREFGSDAEFEAALAAGVEIDAEPGSSALTRGLGKLAAQLERSLHWLRGECRHRAVDIRVCGLSSDIPNLAPWLTARLGLPAELLSLSKVSGLRKVDDRDWHQVASALGAAVSAARRPVFQLYGEGMDGLGGEWLGPRIMTMATLALCILAGAAVDTAVRVNATEREREARLAELRGVSTRVFGQPVDSLQLAQAYLESTQGSAYEGVVPLRGAYDVLAIVSKAATPEPDKPEEVAEASGTGAGDSSSFGTGTGGTTGGMAMGTGTTGGDPSAQADATGTGTGGIVGEDALPGLPVVAADAGIVVDDELVLTSVDIRPRKASLVVLATRASAKERLKRKLEAIECIEQVTAGKTRDRNLKKTFTINFDHDCYRQVETTEQQTDG